MFTFKEFVNGKGTQIFTKVLRYLALWVKDVDDGLRESSEFSDTLRYGAIEAQAVAKSLFLRKPDGFCQFVTKYGLCEWTPDGKGGAYGWVVFLNEKYCLKFTFDHEENHYANMLKGDNDIVPVIDTYKGEAEMYQRPIYVLAMKKLKGLTRELFSAIVDNRTNYWLQAFFLEPDNSTYRDFWKKYTSKSQAFQWSVFCLFTKTFSGAMEPINENELAVKAVFDLVAKVGVKYNIVFLGDFATRNVMSGEDDKPRHIDLQMPLKLKYWRSN